MKSAFGKLHCGYREEEEEDEQVMQMAVYTQGL